MTLGPMPSQIPVDALDSTSTEYYADKMLRYDALYEGGDKFDKKKREFLPKRPIELSQERAGKGNAHYDSRLASAFYTNYAGGIIDWFSAKIVENGPKVVVGDGVSGEPKEYWESLNTDADGLGNPLITICRWAAREVIVNLRAYFSVNLPDDESLDGRISLLDAVTVNDWDSDDRGSLNWIRRTTKECVRNSSEPWKEPKIEAHYWTFYDNEQIIVYRAEREIGAKQWPSGAMATKIEEKTHEFGLPIFDIRSDQSLWIMNRIEQPIVKLFRREAALNWYLDSLSYQMMILNLETPGNYTAIPFTPMGALVLGLNEKAGFLAPDSGGFKANFDAVEQSKRSFYESLQILAKEASAIPQAGRLSGDAVDAMRKPMEVLIGSFAWPIEDALNRLIKALKTHRREEDIDVKLEGFGRVDVDESEIEELLMKDEGYDGQQAREEDDGPEAKGRSGESESRAY